VVLVSFFNPYNIFRALANILIVGYADPDVDGGLEQDLASRRYRAMMPDEEYYSDEY
jgi:hypothetical protein